MSDPHAAAGSAALRRRAAYEAAKARTRLRLARRRRGRPQPLLVHQMGKVASSSVTASLQEAGLDPVYQVHAVSPAGLAALEASYARRWDPGHRGAQHLWQGQWVAGRLAREPQRRWQVVTVVRDPVARNVSSFFQVARSRYGLDLGELARDRSEDEVVDAVRALFLERFDDHEGPVRWVDAELAVPFGVDPWSAPFPRERGWAVLRGERADVLVLRYEDLGRCFGEAVEAFLGLPGVRLASRNVSSGKDYADAYRAVERRLTLDGDYLDRMYGSRYARHFWSDEERAAHRARWVAGTQGTSSTSSTPDAAGGGAAAAARPLDPDRAVDLRRPTPSTAPSPRPSGR
ncbi:putative capsular polysaccharide synthesis family protein [Vallicoccus soli]|uniref:Uncharacterized protein n=1 Tax=Vallicoccus soli TaxID=2339232 RepID=A0A3A3ZMK1_9ACTN|nr:putative capsular polysaccharide synthesis family protein [Vallicoccus soli]RJK97871.1 hypothetical protein D5H78_02555 [Vallicoccus soli]